jgi:hypothetical protein
MGGKSREWGTRLNPGPLHLLFIRAEGGGGGNIIISGGTVYATGVTAGTGSGNGAALATVTVNNKPLIFASSINNRPSSDLPNGILVGSDVDLDSRFISFSTFPAYDPILVKAKDDFAVPATATLVIPPNMNFKLLNTGGRTLTNDGIIDLNGTVTINHAGSTLPNKNTINMSIGGILENSTPAAGIVTNTGIINKMAVLSPALWGQRRRQPIRQTRSSRSPKRNGWSRNERPFCPIYRQNGLFLRHTAVLYRRLCSRFQGKDTIL